MINSPQNPQIKRFRSLLTTKGRRETGLFAVEGKVVVAEMLAAGIRPEVGYGCRELAGDDGLLDQLEAVSREYYELSLRAFGALSEMVSPQGVAAAVARENSSLTDLPEGPGVVLALHELSDPGNMGTMIRSADAAGALGVMAVGEGVDFYHPKVVRATMGSLFHLPLVSCSRAELRAWAQATGAEVVGADPHARESCHQISLPRRVAVLIGNEAHGLGEAGLTACDRHITIPMPGRAESLNAAVAAGILLYEYNRQYCKGDDGEK
jgi:TrmH family RNA methyltransferase